MEQRIADLILLWHGVHVDLGKCIESARVVLDQTDRGTLLPDRVREMRGELIATQKRIPRLADLMEELVGKTVWPMKTEAAQNAAAEAAPEDAVEAALEAEAEAEVAPPETRAGDYDAAGSTPIEQATVDEEAAAEEVDDLRVPERRDDVTGTP